MNVEEFLNNGTGLKWKELRYIQAPYPWFIYIDEKYFRGADKLNNIIEHNLTLEYYDETINNSYEAKIESFLDKEGFFYEKNREWLDNEKLWITIYSLDTFIEKLRKEDDKNVKKR